MIFRLSMFFGSWLVGCGDVRFCLLYWSCLFTLWRHHSLCTFDAGWVKARSWLAGNNWRFWLVWSWRHKWRHVCKEARTEQCLSCYTQTHTQKWVLWKFNHVFLFLCVFSGKSRPNDAAYECGWTTAADRRNLRPFVSNWWRQWLIKQKRTEWPCSEWPRPRDLLDVTLTSTPPSYWMILLFSFLFTTAIGWWIEPMGFL